MTIVEPNFIKVTTRIFLYMTNKKQKKEARKPQNLKKMLRKFFDNAPKIKHR